MVQSIRNYSTHTDRDLLALLGKDNTLAFAELYSRYRHETYRYMVTLVKAPELAEDLVQDVFVKIWDVRKQLEIKHNFRSYLFRVCHNSAVDMNKQIASDHRLFDQLLYHYQVIPAPEQFSPEELLHYDALLEEALNTLSPQRRRIYELCKKEKKSYAVVARELGISPHTVKTHITQTLSILRTYISKHVHLFLVFLLIKKFL
jgi:RNA polymerase sigma-70 factor (family 1)